jgi:hypothetical protein
MANTLEYRIVYLRPNPISDEALAVAVIHGAKGHLSMHGVAHPRAIQRLDSLYGQESRKQILDGLRIFSDVVNDEQPALTDVKTVVDLFSIGDIASFYSEQPEYEASFILHQVSSLYTAVMATEDGSDVQVSQKIFANRLRDEMSFHNVMAATALFRGYNVVIGAGQSMKVPIYGDRVAGIAVSFNGSNPAGSKINAEAFIARMLVAQRTLGRKPVVYSLSPSLSEKGNQNVIDGYLEELRLIGNVAGVAVRNERSVKELALSILRDDEKLVA